jgi:hypothetical protein
MILDITSKFWNFNKFLFEEIQVVLDMYNNLSILSLMACLGWCLVGRIFSVVLIYCFTHSQDGKVAVATNYTKYSA